LISDSVTFLGDYAFSYCSNVKTISIGKGLSYLPDYAFWSCRSLGTIVLPNSITIIGTGAFASCWALTNVSIPESVVSIGIGAFRGCSELGNIFLPNGVKSLGASAFFGCRSLTNISLPSTLSEIGSEAFSRCDSLKSITIPANIETIASAAFNACTALESVYFLGDAITPDFDLFTYCDLVTVFHLENRSGWSSQFSGRPTSIWRLALQINGSLDNAQTGLFTIQGAPAVPVVVESTSDLLKPNWVPITTNVIPASGTLSVGDQSPPQAARFYRLLSK
jgi:hypothetical protein